MTASSDRAPHPGSPGGQSTPGTIRERVTAYLREHHTATIATVGPEGAADAGLPHAASVFYAVDDRLRLVFLSKRTSRHGGHIAAVGHGAPVAVTVAGLYDDWREIRGLQIWGRAELPRGIARAGAMATYLRRFPFVGGLLKDPRLARQLGEIEVFRVTPERIALTDNSVGYFGREVLELGDRPPAVSDGGRLRGTVVTGRNEAAGFIDVPWVKEQLTGFLGVAPYPGTLNLELRDPAARATWERLAQGGVCLELSPSEEGFCSGAFYPVVVGGTVAAGIVLPRVPGYPADVIELVAGERLRDALGLHDGDEVVVEWE